MTQLTADNMTFKGPLLGEALTRELTIENAEILYSGGFMAVDYAGEVKMASDTLGLKIIGFCPRYIDNTNDGEKSQPPAVGICRVNNSANYPISASMIGKAAYVEDDNTAAAFSTNLVVAGLIHDVDTDGVWIDTTPAAMAMARSMALIKIVAITATTATLTAAQCFQGNVVITADNVAGVVLTLPAIQAGLRIGVQRIDGTAAHDVSIQAPATDTVRGSAVGKKVVNDTDAVSDILWLETDGAVGWIDAAPLAKDRAEWAVDNS